MVRIEEKLFYPIPPTAPVPEFKGSTLLIPSVSVGNVPQLACDLLIATLKIPLVGYLHSSYIYAAVGTKEGQTVFGRGGIACPLEGTFNPPPPPQTKYLLVNLPDALCYFLGPC